MSDEYQSIPVAVARAAVQASGELAALEGPYYLAPDGEWLSYILPGIYESGHPEVARVIIERKGQKPREVVISWAEYAEQMDADPEWDALRARKPMSIFGAEVERHAYRVVFADVLAVAMPPRLVAPIAGDVDVAKLKNDRLMVIGEPWDPPARDWIAEVKVADAQALNALYDEARAAGALAKVEGLQGAIMGRTLDLEHPKPTPRPQGQGQRRRRSKPRP